MADASQKPCLCASLRKATRVITRRYDEHLKPSGLKLTQYSALMNITRNPGVTVTELAKIMVMDQTTMTRNIQVLAKQGFLDIGVSGADQRAKVVSLSTAGQEKIEEASPYWAKAQQEMEQEFGALGFDKLLGSLNDVLNA